TLLLITAIAASMLMLTNTDTNISTNFRDEQTAFFAAKAGLEEVRDRLRIGAANSLNASLPGAADPSTAPPIPGQSGGVLYVTNSLNGETVAPWNIQTATTYPDAEICVDMLTINYPGAGCSSGGTIRPLPSSTVWYNTTTSSFTYASS